MMDYLDWIRALDRAQQYAELNGAVLTSNIVAPIRRGVQSLRIPVAR